jgi:hypothetical protein
MEAPPTSHHKFNVDGVNNKTNGFSSTCGDYLETPNAIFLLQFWLQLF